MSRSYVYADPAHSPTIPRALSISMSKFRDGLGSATTRKFPSQKSDTIRTVYSNITCSFALIAVAFFLLTTKITITTITTITTAETVTAINTFVI